MSNKNEKMIDLRFSEPTAIEVKPKRIMEKMLTFTVMGEILSQIIVIGGFMMP